MRTNNVDLIYDLQKEKDRAIFKELSLFTKKNHNNFIPNNLINNIKHRQSGKTFTFSEHIKGLVYSHVNGKLKSIDLGK